MIRGLGPRRSGKGRMDTVATRTPARDGSNDGRTGVIYEGASSLITWTLGSKMGCRLPTPRRLLRESAGTMTRSEYMEWADSQP